MKPERRSLAEIVGGGYADFWRTQKRYRVVKGSRASKKSKTTALWFILRMMQNPQANTLVVRRFERTLRDSCFADLQWAIARLGVESDWKATTSPLQLTRISTGQKILFRGMDDGLKITSISVATGALCWVWVEEAYELAKEDDFNKLDMSIRGVVPEGLFKQVTLTFNPWNESSWLKRRFFDTPSDDVFALTTNYLCNEWLDETDRRLFEEMRINNPRRYRIEGLGEWGVSEGLIYDRVSIESFDVNALRTKRFKAWFGMDFGFTDPSAFVGGYVDTAGHKIYVAWEIYRTGKTNQEMAALIKELGLRSEPILCDAAEPKSIAELRVAGLNARAASKGPDSVRFGIQSIQNFDIVIQPECRNFAHEIQNYAWEKDRTGNPTDRPEHDFSHGMDAMRYGLSDIYRAGVGRIHPNNLATLGLR